MVTTEEIEKVLKSDGVHFKEQELNLIRDLLIELARIEYESFLEKSKEMVGNKIQKQEISINTLKKAS
jgi:hypothetical protein